MDAAHKLPPDPVEEVVFRLLESSDRHAELKIVESEDPEMAARARRLLDRLTDQGLLEERSGPDVAPTSGVARIAHYEVRRQIGEGGMGVVYEAFDQQLDRRVALKLTRTELLPFDKSRQRFDNEIAALARLQHPGIVQVLSAGEDQGRRYYAMEFVDGESLQQVLARLQGQSPSILHGAELFAAEPADEPAPERVALQGASWIDASVRIVRDVALALSHAHQQGVLHRDIKPGNIMLGTDGRARLLDFGLARADDWQTMTRSGAMIGSLPYMSPEQVRGTRDGIDERTDVYALGVVLFELLTLRSPFVVDDDQEKTRTNILRGSPLSLRRHRPDVSQELTDVVLRALSRDPDARQASAGALAGELDALLARRPLPGGGSWRRLTRRFAPAVAVATAVAAVGVVVLAIALANSVSRERRAAEEVAGARLSVQAAQAREMVQAQTAVQFRLSSARSAIARAHVPAARNTLAEIPEQHRGWEWRQLQRRTELAGRTWTLPHASGAYQIGAGTDHLSMLFGGRHVLLCQPASGLVRDLKEIGRQIIPDPVRSRALSADGRVMASVPVGDTSKVFLGEPIRHRARYVELDRDVARAFLADDGTLCWAACTDGTGIVLQTANGTELRRFPATRAQQALVVFSPDNRWACVVSAAGPYELVELATGRTVWRVEETGRVIDLVFSPDGTRIHLLAGSEHLKSVQVADGRIVMHQRLQQRRLLDTAPAALLGLACDPDGDHLWARSTDAMLHCLHLPTQFWVHSEPAFHAYAKNRIRIMSMAVDPVRHRLLASNMDRSVTDLDLRAVKSGWLTPVGSPCFTCATINTAGDLFVGVFEGPPTLRLAGEDPVVLEDLPRAQACLFVDETRVVLAPCKGGELLVYDIGSGEVAQRLEGAESAGRALCLLPDGRLAVGQLNGSVRVWNLERSEAELVFEAHGDRIVSMAAGPDGRLATASWDGRVKLWDLATKKEQNRWQMRGKARCVAISPDGKWLAYAGREGIEAIDLSGQHPAQRVSAREGTSVAFTTDGQRLLIGYDSSVYVRVIAVGTWRAVTSLRRRHRSGIQALGFGRDGTTLYSIDKNGLVCIWPGG